MLPTVGVEEELLVVDLSDGSPTPRFADLERATRRISTPDGGPLVEHELKAEQAEIASAPFADLDAVLADLQNRRSALAAAARTEGLGVAALACSPLPVDPTPTPDARYQTMQDRFGLLATRQLTCGAHVHVAVESRAAGVAVLDRIRVWLATLVALSANSPYWDGQDTAYASYRSVLWSQWPTAGPAGRFGDLDTYQRTLDQLLSSATILDTGMVYFDARLSARFPTVEVRVADVCRDVRHSVLVAALVRALVVTALADARDGAPPPEVRTELLRVAAWRAARSGVADELVDVATAAPRPAPDVVDRLIDHVGAALRRSGDEDRVRTGLDEILAAGTGADRQRAVQARTGTLEAVVLDAVRATSGQTE